MNLRNISQRQLQTVEGHHNKGRVKTYSDKLGESLKVKYPRCLQETLDPQDEISPRLDPEAAGKAVEERIKTAPRNGKKAAAKPSETPKDDKPEPPAPEKPKDEKPAKGADKK